MIKENGLYVAFITYNAQLTYVPADEQRVMCLYYRRFWAGQDKMQAVILTPEENIGVKIIRHWLIDGFPRKSVSKSEGFRFSDGAIEEFVGFDLLRRDAVTK